MRRADADELGRVIEANLAHLRPWMGWVHPYDRTATHAYVEVAERDAGAMTAAQFVLVRAGAIAGTIGFHGFDWGNRATSIGYWLAADAQGAGLVTTAVRALCDHAFREWGMHRVQLRAAPGNVRSRAVAERCGFAEEGVAREAEYVGGVYRDLVVYSLLAP